MKVSFSKFNTSKFTSKTKLTFESFKVQCKIQSAIYLVPIQYSCICVERNGILDGNSIFHNTYVNTYEKPI